MTIVAVATREELKLVDELGLGGYPIILTGVGGVNVITALKDLPKDTEIINVGYCGSNNIEISTKVEIGDVWTYHPSVEFCERYQCISKSKYSCFTSTDFVTKTDIKEPCVFDMELAFICALGFKVRAYKFVSDNLSLKEYEKNKGE